MMYRGLCEVTMASRQSSLSATTIGSDSNGVVQGSGLLDAQAGPS